MSTLLAILMVAALVWKPIWATFRLMTTKVEAKKVKYRDRIAEWQGAVAKVFF